MIISQGGKQGHTPSSMNYVQSSNQEPLKNEAPVDISNCRVLVLTEADKNDDLSQKSQASKEKFKYKSKQWPLKKE